jgi:hypothetical protein
MKLIILFSIVLLTSFSPYKMTDRCKWNDIRDIVIAECNRYPSKKINYRIIRSIIFYESGIQVNSAIKNEVYSPTAKSGYGSIGLMQIAPITIKEYNRKHKIYCKKEKIKFNPLLESDLYKIKINIKIGIWCFADKLELKKGNIVKALEAYSGNAEKYAEKILMRTYLYYIYNK